MVNPGTKLSTPSWVMQNASLSITLLMMPMKCSKLNTKGGAHCCYTSSGISFSPLYAKTASFTIKWWEEANRGALGKSFPFVLVFIKQTTRSWQRFLQQHLTSPQECNGTRGWKKRKQCKLNGRPERPAHISSLLTVLRVTPGILIKVYVRVSVRVAFKKTERNWLVYG